MDELIKRINELAKKKKSAGLTKEEAEDIKAKLEAEGAKVTLK